MPAETGIFIALGNLKSASLLKSSHFFLASLLVGLRIKSTLERNPAPFHLKDKYWIPAAIPVPAKPDLSFHGSSMAKSPTGMEVPVLIVNVIWEMQILFMTTNNKIDMLINL